MTIDEIAQESRTIRDSNGTVFGMRHKPLATVFRMLCRRYGIENWRTEFRPYA